MSRNSGKWHSDSNKGVGDGKEMIENENEKEEMTDKMSDRELKRLEG